MITIITPVYNRKYILGKLYESLKKQTCFDFEWVIIDDGSTDVLEQIVQEWRLITTEFHIVYQYQKNGGKHRAINRAVKIASGEFLFLVDSDDWLADDTIEYILSKKDLLENDSWCAGIGFPYYEYISGKKKGNFPEGETLVKGFLGKQVELGITGDICKVFKKSVLINYPFPEYENEFFLSEGTTWNLMAIDGYNFYFCDKKLYYAEYLPDGLTRNLFYKLVNSPLGWTELIKTRKKIDERGWKKAEIQCFYHIHKRYSEKKVCDLLEITREQYQNYTKKLEQFREKIKNILDENNINNIALYGFGLNAYYFLEHLKDIDKNIEYGIDRKAEFINYTSIYTLEDGLPEVEAVFITIGDLKEISRLEIEKILRNKLPSAKIWSLHEIDETMW